MATPAPKESVEELTRRALTATSPEDRARCLADIEAALDAASEPAERGRLFICRARLRHNQYHYPLALDDALAATALFEEAGETGLALDAVSRAAVMASRVGLMSLATELATKSVLGVEQVDDDRLRAEVANRLGAFCASLLDYDRAVAQFEAGLAAAERAGDTHLVRLELYNVANALLLGIRADQASSPSALPRPEDEERFERAGHVLERLLSEVAPEPQLALSARLVQAELLADRGLAEDALEVLELLARDSSGTYFANEAQRAAASMVESRSLRALGRSAEAVAAAERAVQLATASGDDHELMLMIEERLAARRAAGDLAGVAADALEVKRLMWAIYRRQTAQVVDQVWERAAFERERRQLEEKTAAAVRSAEQDALTGIGNRRLLERFLVHGAEVPGALALVMVDIDHFKDINDTFGHDLGDMVLRALGELFAAQTRPGQVVVRYGGEEFVFAMPGVELAVAAGFAERARLSVASHSWEHLDARLEVTISLGVSAGRSDRWRQMLKKADDALYMAKRRGRNRVEVDSLALEQTAG